MMNEKPICCYLVLELGTGLVDGWYCKQAVEGMRDYWDQHRFPFKHVVVELAETDRTGHAYLPNGMLMNKQPEIYFRESRN